MENLGSILYSLFIISIFVVIIILLAKLAAKNRKNRRNRIGEAGERAVERKLENSFSGYHKQLNNIFLVDEFGKSHQIDHIELRTNGIFCIETKNYKGWIFGSENEDRWTQTLYDGEKHSLLNPLKQNKSHCYQLKRVIGNKYHVNSLVVMVQNNAEKINCENVINIRNLNSYLSNYDDGTTLSKSEIDELDNKIRGAAVSMTTEEHVQNIHNTQNQIANGICPRCDGKLIRRNGKNGTFWGCSNYPKCKFTQKDK